MRRQIIDIPLDELLDVEKTFGKMVSLDPNAIPNQFSETFEETRRIAYQHYTISAIFESFPVLKTFKEGRTEGLILENGDALSLGEVSKVFSESFELGFLVASLNEHIEAVGQFKSSDNMLTELFLDAWSTALIGSGEKWLMEYIRKKVTDQGLHMTNSFGPGQGSIPLEMQRIILDNLQASQIGVSLNSHFMMEPKKTVTGIFGIQKSELTDLLKPCDLCKLSASCPTAYS